MTGDSVNISDYMLRTAEMIIRVAEVIDEEESRQFISEILSGRRIYVTGAGRSGLVAKAFAIRLMHLGFPCYVIGETITPAFDSGDMLVVFSGSGETKSVVSAAEKVRELGGWSCLITANPDSQAAGYVDLVIDLGESSGNSADLPP
ncbi:MAG: SIS domain-containing protein, partial [Methanocalculus sp.]|nr:SIS domain-containing protein [Methanocalculus sp.]